VVVTYAVAEAAEDQAQAGKEKLLLQLKVKEAAAQQEGAAAHVL
jgi:hypothetical protein